jgi:RNA polymerase primary sigma factor
MGGAASAASGMEDGNMANSTKYAAEGLSQYLRQLGGHQQLTREQEYELARRARKGDESARQTLATSNLAFVVAVAKKFANRGARLDDLIQEGNVGLMKAIEHFDPKKNVRFATYLCGGFAPTSPAT